MSTKKQTKSGVKAKGQHYCYCCGVICATTKHRFTMGSIEMARTTTGKDGYCCSLTCMKAIMFRKDKVILDDLLKKNTDWYNLICVFMRKAIELGNKFPKPLIILGKSLKIQNQICKLLLKHEWLKSGLLYMENKDLFTEAGETLLLGDFERKYMAYLNRLEALKQLGKTLMEVSTANEQGSITIDTQGLWE